MEPEDVESQKSLPIEDVAEPSSRRGCDLGKGSHRGMLVMTILSTVAMLTFTAVFVLPEWFVLIGEDELEWHYGFFMRCVYTPDPEQDRCFQKIIHETSASITMFFLTLLTGSAAVGVGIQQIVKTRCFSNEESVSLKVYSRMIVLLVVAGLGGVCGMATFTYLYSTFLSPPAASYVPGWIACALFLAASLLGMLFRKSTTAVEAAREDCDANGNATECKNEEVPEKIWTTETSQQNIYDETKLQNDENGEKVLGGSEDTLAENEE